MSKIWKSKKAVCGEKEMLERSPALMMSTWFRATMWVLLLALLTFQDLGESAHFTRNLTNISLCNSDRRLSCCLSSADREKHRNERNVWRGDKVFKWLQNTWRSLIARQQVQFEQKFCIYCTCMFTAGFISVCTHMNVYLHACPLKPKHGSAEHASAENRAACVYLQIYTLHTEYKCQNTLESTAHVLQSAWKSNAKIRICFIPLPYFYSLEKYPH